jgi:hypothetical protein
MSLAPFSRKTSFDPKKDMRAFARAHVGAEGAIFFPERQYEERCVVSDLSPDGASLKSWCSVSMGSNVIVYIKGLGRFEGRIVRRDRLRVAVQFKCSDAKRERMAELIAEYAEFGSVGSTKLRKGPRLSGGATLHSFMRASGQEQACEIIDMAMSGAYLKTEDRPVVGEVIFFGRTRAVVVRHTACGIAVSFANANAAPTARTETDASLLG